MHRETPQASQHVCNRHKIGQDDDDDDGEDEEEEDDEDDDDVGVILSERRPKTSAEGIPPGNALCAGPERVGISHRHLGKFSMEKPEARSLFTCANMWSNSPQLT